MKKIQVMGVALVFASGMAFAAGPMWTPNSPNGQVQFPWVVDCTSNNDGDDIPFDEDDENDPCFKKMGGFWWGYLYGWEAAGEVGPRKCAGEPGQTAIGGPTSAINKVEAKISGEWVNFNGTDDPKCMGPDVTDRSNGHSLIGEALEVRMTVGGGFIEAPVYAPSGSGFGVTMVESESESTPRNVASHKGLCLTYASDHQNTKVGLENSGANLQLALGWNEGYETSPEARDKFNYGIDGWYAIIPPTGGLDKKVTKDFIWDDPNPIYGTTGGVANESGDFMQENFSSYADWTGVVPGAPFKIDTATQKMTSVKIVWKGYEASTINFKLYAFGWAGDCGEATPVVVGKVRPASPVSFAMIGKTLSMNSTAGKPLAVQVINLKGAVVQSKVMKNGDELNLQNLPTGIYMIRVPALNYTVKQTVR